MATDFAAAVRQQLEPLLEPGESLRGVVAATHQKVFSGSLYGVGVTDWRLILQPLGRRLEPKGEPRSIVPEALVSAEIDAGIGGGSWSVPSAIVDLAALSVVLRTTDGAKMKLMMMKGGGGLFGRLGGGEAQQEGIRALAEWMQRRFGSA